MSATVAITRTDLTSTELRRAAGKCRDARAARRMLALALALEGADRFGVKVHEQTVDKYLAALGYRWLSVRPWHPKTDPDAQEVFGNASPKR